MCIRDSSITCSSESAAVWATFSPFFTAATDSLIRAVVFLEAIAVLSARPVSYTHLTTCSVLTSIDEQSSDIAMGVDHSLETKEGKEEDNNGAGDQGMMFGYACDETPELMPLSISLAHRLAKQLTAVRKDGTLDYLRPDGKTQVTIEYENDVPKRVDTIVISTQHSDTVELETIRKDLKKYVIDVIIDPTMMDENTKIYINPTGRFVIGGPQGDSCLLYTS